MNCSKCLNYLTVFNFCSCGSCTRALYLLHFVQSPAKVEHFDAAMASVSGLLIAVMEAETALMAVMRLDVVSYQSIQGGMGNIPN